MPSYLYSWNLETPNTQKIQLNTFIIYKILLQKKVFVLHESFQNSTLKMASDIFNQTTDNSGSKMTVKKQHH